MPFFGVWRDGSFALLQMSRFTSLVFKLIWSLSQRGRRDRRGMGGHPTVLQDSHLPNLRHGALHRDVCRMLWAPFRPSQTDASNLGCTEVTSAEQKKVPRFSSRETKALDRNPRDAVQYWSEQKRAGKILGESANEMCPFITTEKLRNFRCPPKV